MNLNAALVIGTGLAAAVAGPGMAFDCAAGLPYHAIGSGVLGGYDYSALGGGFIVVESRTAHPSGEWIVLEHCPTRQDLSLLGDPTLPANATNTFWRMVNSDQSFTFDQMADAILQPGMTLSTGQGVADSCPCALEADPVTRKAAD